MLSLYSRNCNISINNSPWEYVRGAALLHGLQFCSKENIYFKENIGTRALFFSPLIKFNKKGLFEAVESVKKAIMSKGQAFAHNL